MGNAKVTIKQQDRSAIVPALSGIEIGTVVNAKWGPIEPSLVTSPNQLLSRYYKPDNTKGSSWNGAELLLSQSNKVYITRAIHGDAKYSAALVRFKIDPADFNSYPQPTATPDLIVKPLAAGIALDAVDTYSFPLYNTTRLYAEMAGVVSDSYTSALTIEVSSLTNTADTRTLTAGDFISFGETVNQSSAIHEIESAQTVQVTEEVVTLSAAVTAPRGTEVKRWDGTQAVSYSPAVFLTADAEATNQIKVTNSDLLVNGQSITVDNGLTNAVVSEKNLVTRDAHQLTFTSAVTVAAGSKIHLMTQYELEQRDAFLVVAKYPGDLGDRIKVGIRASADYPGEAFWVDVYFEGVLQESFHVARKQFLDGFGKQMYIENVINGTSNYIEVKDNLLAPPDKIPLVTDYGVWRRNPTDIFNPTGVTLIEDVLKGDTVISVTDVTSLSVNARIKFGANGAYEYKILSKSGVDNTITLDRPVIETKINAATVIHKFDPNIEDADNGIFAGVQHYKFTKISPVTDYKIGETYLIGVNDGKILDAGFNNCAGGHDGSAVTLFDVIAAFNKMQNKEKYKISVFCDNGFAYPEVAIAINTICKNNGLAHGFLSTSLNEERKADYVTAIKDYRNSTNLNTEFCSMFTGWVQVTDVHNQTRVWVAPSVFGVNAQSFVTRNYNIFSPAAGWVRGRLDGLKVSRQFTDGERDALVDANLNPIRYREGYGLAIWGNETLYVKPSPLQLRSVAMLLIVLKYGLETYLEFELFMENNEETWTRAETAISTFIRDTLYIPGGLYDYQVKIKDIITDTDIDNRRMPIFVGIQPTSDIKEIPVNLGIFNKSVAITV